MPIPVGLLRKEFCTVGASKGSLFCMYSEMVAQVATLFEKLVAIAHATLEYLHTSTRDFVTEFDGLVPSFWVGGKRLW